MHVVDAVIVVVWVAFWIYWLAAAIETKATRRWSRSGLGVRLVILVLIVASFHSGVLKGSGTIDNLWLGGFGLAVFLSGLALAVWARVHLGRNWGTPMSQKVDPELVTTGPYRLVRHPIYTGIIVGMIGTTMAVTVYWAVGVVLVGGYFVYAATVEERNMARLFPDTYPDYKRRTKMLIPFVF